MAYKSWMTHLMLLLMTWKESLNCNGLRVDPPENLTVLDPGQFGHLVISWSPPRSLINVTNCSTLYHLEYFNTYRGSWSAARMSIRSFSAQFDLMKDIKVRVSTILDGPCTNNTMIQSTNYTELIQKPPSTGVVDTEVQNFSCVFHNMEYLECNWKRSPKTPANSKQNLYFWHKKLDQAVECPKYITSGGVSRRGCNFTGTSLPKFTNIIFCVNGSSPEGPLKPTFVSLQIQNHVKPATTKTLHLQTGPDMELRLQWESPVGRVPGHCLEWEVEHNHEGPDGKTSLQTKSVTRQTSLTLPSVPNSKRNCFKVRSKLHKYCADKSIWSDWSHPKCDQAINAAVVTPSGGNTEGSSSGFTGFDDMLNKMKKEEEIAPEPEWSVVPVYIYIAAAIIAVLVLSLCVGAAFKVKKSRQEEKPNSLLTTLFARNPALAAAET